MDHAIETERLTCRYGRTRAVVDLTMRVPAGSLYALLGPNGAGKTTTLKTLMNLRPPTSGVARVLGVDSRALGPSDFARIGYVSENQRIPSNLTIAEIEAFCRPWYPTWDATLATELRERFGLDPRARIKTLSRGTRLKVQCLLALAPRPRLLILDEPFSGLDPVVRDDLTTGVLSLADRDGWSALLTSHEMDDVERLADHVGFLANGALIVEEPMTSLLARFRRVEVALPDGAAVPAQPPASWLGFSVDGRAARFVESQASPAADAAWRSVFPGAAIESGPLSLREVFVALTRSIAPDAGERR
ncbi:MAG: ABC transporter ATP-binding protein [Vicinamibacteraceae bacterium]